MRAGKLLMNDGMPSEGGEDVRNKLSELMLFLDGAASDVARKYAALKAGEAGPLSDVAKDMAELRKWAAMAYEERERIEKLIGEKSGNDPDHAINFAEARASIGRRLARLRAVGDAGGVSK
jgi:hypothetical protein